MMPIVEPPMTPLHEVSLSIPDYVKFGPILPKSAGFSPVLKYRENAREASGSASSLNCFEVLILVIALRRCVSKLLGAAFAIFCMGMYTSVLAISASTPKTA